MVYNLYPAVDNGTYQFPPVVRSALAVSPELRNTIVPMTEIDRNDLAGADLWPDRFVFNTDTNKINRYDAIALLWREIDSDNKVLRTGDTMTGPLTLSGTPTQDLHASTKKYVDDTDAARKTYIDTADGLLLPKAGGTMTGALTLPGAPTQDLHASTKKYVDDTNIRFTYYVKSLQAVATGTAWTRIATATSITGDDAAAFGSGLFTAPTAGIWQFEYQAVFNGNMDIALRMRFGGSADRVTAAPANATGITGVCQIVTLEIAASTVVDFYIKHNSASSQNITQTITAVRLRA